MGVYYNGPEKEQNIRPITATLIIVGALVLVFGIAPFLFGERCSYGPKDSQRVYASQGADQIVGPTMIETCSPPFVLLSEKTGSIVAVAWFLLPIFSLLMIIIGVIIQLKTK